MGEQERPREHAHVPPQPPPVSAGRRFVEQVRTTGFAGLGLVLFVAGLALWFGNLTGLFPSLSYAGYAVGTAGALLTAAGLSRHARNRDAALRARLSPEAYARARAAGRDAAAAAERATDARERRLRRYAAPATFLLLAASAAIFAGMLMTGARIPTPVTFLLLMAPATALWLWVSSREASQNARVRLADLGEASAEADGQGLGRALRKERIALIAAAAGGAVLLVGLIPAVREALSLLWVAGMMVVALGLDRWRSFRVDTDRIRREIETLRRRGA